MRVLILMLLAVLAAGCDRESLAKRFTTPEVMADARNHVAALQKRDFAAVEAAMDERLRRELESDTLSRMADLIPPGPPSSIELLEARHSIGSEVKTYHTVFEYLFGDKSVVISLAFEEHDGVRKIVTFYINPQPAPIREQTRFSFEGKGFTQYAVFAGAVSALLISLFALVKCARTKGLKRRWLWVIGILVGFGNVSVIWQTGELGISPVAFQLLSAAYHTSVLGPTIVSFSIPLVALLFLSRYRKGSPVRVAIDPAADQSTAG